MRGGWSVLGAMLAMVAVPAMAQGVRCDRGDLQRVSDAYLAAQTIGDPIKLPLADFTQYAEQMEDATLFSGAIAKPMKVEVQRSVLDVPSCTTFVLALGADRAVAARLQFSGRENPIAPSRTNDIETVVGGAADAARLLAAAKGDAWGAIPAGERDSRATLQKAADAALDALGEKTVERRYIVDEETGAVAVLLRLGSAGAPDAHLFRIEKGKVRATEAVTARR